MANTVAYQEGQHNKISAIVDHVLFKKTLPDVWFQWMLEMGLWQLRELKLDVFQDVKTYLLPVTDRKTVLLPSCFLDWVKIGVKVGQYVVTMSVNDKLTTLPRDPNSSDFVAGLLSQNLPNGLNFNNYGGYYFFNYNGSSLASCGGGFATKGMFKIHDNGICKEILLDYDYPFTEVYVECITDGFEPCGETVVDPYFCDFVAKAMEFEWEQEKEPAKTEASIYRRGTAMEIAASKCRARKNNLDPQTLLNITRAQVRFTPKI